MIMSYQTALIIRISNHIIIVNCLNSCDVILLVLPFISSMVFCVFYFVFYNLQLLFMLLLFMNMDVLLIDATSVTITIHAYTCITHKSTISVLWSLS